LLGGAAIVQYRHKTAQPVQRMEQAAALLSLCRQYQKPLIINDHLDLCQALDADGLHVGGTDIDVAAARAALGEHKIVGASCYGDLQRAKMPLLPVPVTLPSVVFIRRVSKNTISVRSTISSARQQISVCRAW
jgi:thiamine-phosphate diphosphorylase